MVLHPLLLFGLLCLLLLEVVTVLVIGDNESIGPLGILDAVGVIIVLRRCLNDVAFRSKCVQKGYIVRHLRSLVLLDVELAEFFLQSYLVVAK